jgi:hypothetical protein
MDVGGRTEYWQGRESYENKKEYKKRIAEKAEKQKIIILACEHRKR